MTIKKIVLILCLVLLVNENNAQTIEGTSGLFFIPSAEIQKDGQLTLGASFVDKELVSFSGYKKDAFTPYLSVAFLPFAEFSIRITRIINYEGNRQGIGDRTFSARIRFIEEGELFPAVLVGMHDLMTVFGGTEAIRNNAFYFVATKNYKIDSGILNNIMINAGYGTDWFEAQNHHFVGLFGGVSCNLWNHIELMTEYDGKYTNGGIRLKLFDHFSLLAGMLRFKNFSGSASVNFSL